MREVDGRDREVLFFDVVPDVEFSPVGNREHPYVLARMDATIKIVEQFGSLILGVPLSKVVAHRKYPFLCPRFFFIAARTTHAGIQSMFFDRAEQGSGLQHISTGELTSFFYHATCINVVLHIADDKFNTGLLYKPIAKFNRLRKVVSRIDVNQREWNLSRVKGLLSEPYKCDGVFATGKKNRRTLKLSCRLAYDVDRFVFEIFRKNFQILTHPDLSLFSWFCFVKS